MDMEQPSTISQEGFPTLEDLQQQQGNEQLTLFSLRELAINSLSSIDQLKEQLKQAREMLTDALLRNTEISAQQDIVKNAQDALKSATKVAMTLPEVMALEEKVRSIRSEIKDKQETVSNSAIEAYRLTGNTEFEKDGIRYQIVTTARLKKVRK